MSATTKLHQQRAAQLDTEVIKNILNTLQSPENQESSSGFPLAGLVHLSGVGQISVTVLRAELDRRSA